MRLPISPFTVATAADASGQAAVTGAHVLAAREGSGAMIIRSAIHFPFTSLASSPSSLTDAQQISCTCSTTTCQCHLIIITKLHSHLPSLTIMQHQQQHHHPSPHLITLPLHKFSYAEDAASQTDKFSWKHTTKDLMVVFDTYRSLGAGQSSQMMKVLQGSLVLVRAA